MKHRVPIVIALASIAGCMAPVGDESVAGREEASYVLTTVAWTDPTNIPVCWETGGREGRKSYIREAVEAQFEGRSEFRVDFTGWGRCTRSSRGIRIRVADEQPRVVALGEGLDGRPNGMILNFSFDNWGGKWCDWLDEDDCSRKVAIHEFGHALGLAHEQNRPDTPDGCDDAPQGTDGDLYVGPWDADSVMNYCNDDWNNDGYLSQGDIVGLARLYGGNGDVYVSGVQPLTGWFTRKAHDRFCYGREQCEVGDFDGDGRDDILTFNKATGAAFVAISDGTRFNGTGWRWVQDFCRSGDTCLVGDLQGDGKDDILRLTRGSTRDAYAALADNGKFVKVPWKYHDDLCGAGETCRLGDVDANGFADLVVFGHGTGAAGGNVWVAFNGGGAFEDPVRVDWDFCFDGQTCVLADVNGDGRSDALSFDGTSGDVRVAMAQRWPSGNTSFLGTSHVLPGLCHDAWECAVAPHDSPAAFLASFSRDEEASATVGYFDDGSVQSDPWAQGACAATDVCRIADVDGNGIPEIVAFTRNHYIPPPIVVEVPDDGVISFGTRTSSGSAAR